MHQSKIKKLLNDGQSVENIMKLSSQFLRNWGLLIIITWTVGVILSFMAISLNKETILEGTVSLDNEETLIFISDKNTNLLIRPQNITKSILVYSNGLENMTFIVELQTIPNSTSFTIKDNNKSLLNNYNNFKVRRGRFQLHVYENKSLFNYIVDAILK